MKSDDLGGLEFFSSKSSNLRYLNTKLMPTELETRQGSTFLTGHKSPELKYTDPGKVSSALEVPHDHGTLSAPRRHLKRQE